MIFLNTEKAVRVRNFLIGLVHRDVPFSFGIMKNITIIKQP